MLVHPSIAQRREGTAWRGGVVFDVALDILPVNWLREGIEHVRLVGYEHLHVFVNLDPLLNIEFRLSGVEERIGFGSANLPRFIFDVE